MIKERASNEHYQVSPADIDAYQRDGVVCLRGVIGQNDVQAMHDAVLAFMERSEGAIKDMDRRAEGGGRFFTSLYMGKTDEHFRAFAEKSALGAVAGQLMRADRVRFFYDQLFVKTPGKSETTKWHHDLTFWPFEGGDIISMWVALTPSDAESSGLQYVAGSHTNGKRYRPETPDLDESFGDASLERCPDYNDPAIRSSVRMLSWDMAPGDVVCHHPLVVHGASENFGDQTRIGLSIRYFGNDVQWMPRSDLFLLPIPIPPAVEPGEYPEDDRSFPVVYDSQNC